MVVRRYGTKILVFVVGLFCLNPVVLSALQNVPDAPAPKASTTNQFPDNAPAAPKNTRTADPPPAAATPTPSPQAPEGLVTDLKQFGSIVVSVNFVQVPVTVKDEKSGKLISGLGPTDFTIYEDGVAQRLRFFSSDSFPLTAAIVICSDLPSSSMKKVNDSLPALIGAFSQFDEVALYRYGHTVTQVSGYTGAENVNTVTIARVKGKGRQDGPPAVFGPLATGPTINGHEADPGVRSAGVGVNPQAPPPVQESWVLNDAILRAAQDLSKRERSRRKIIFVVSDGRELNSKAGFDEVKKVLLSYNISVYAMGVDTAALPVYDKLGRLRVPGFGYANILPKYAAATGGDAFAEFDRQSIEQAYSQITAVARNQYTLGYNAKNTPSTTYRAIEVRVHRPGLKVIAKDGYYPLPPQGSGPANVPSSPR